MNKGIRTVVYDEALHLEAYHLKGIVQPFPNHFHECYVIGLMEDGERCMCCKNQKYILKKNDIILFNPGDSHLCFQNDGHTLSYRAINISRNRMLDLAEETIGKRETINFSKSVIRDQEVACLLHELHIMILDGFEEFNKEEKLMFLIALLYERCGQPFSVCLPEYTEEIEKVSNYIQEHYRERISLSQLCQLVNLSKSTLLRVFTKRKGVTPYRYLETVRINAAKKLLEQGISPLETAMKTGFSDQSHFTNYFSQFIGLSPGSYHQIFFDKPRTDSKK
jgi:AraC-like DNA-binding protein